MSPALMLSVALILFAIGLFGVLFRRNFLVILMSLELMLNASNLAILTASQMFGKDGLQGHFLVLMILVIAAVEVAIGLAIAIHMYRTANTVEVDALSELPK
ncbi:MAG: NADH-quinone oxidoreductase subunit NuoK [Thermotogae bacterium]|nr:NADH-quinone oxidoreductase subunit NuoK [Thermotogota bacterium]